MSSPMKPSNFLISFFFCCSFLIASGHVGMVIQGSPLHHRQEDIKLNQQYGHALRPTKLFVFGDSYADTGNIRKSLGRSAWMEPYGTTFPGKPAGRFSDGRILTDYIAKFLGLKSPFAYEWRKLGGKKLRNGMNFAYGGSGVFNTFADILPNMSTQIGFLERLMHESLYSKHDLQSSVVFVCLAGNDYAAYITQGGTMQGLQSFIPKVINQLALNLKQIYKLGARRVIITALPPIGCLPQMTEMTFFRRCNATQNTAVVYHNLLLQQAITKLNNETKTSSSMTFFILDLYGSFTTLLEHKAGYHGNMRFESPLKPCCMGVSGYFCGSMDDKGNKLYTVCSDPKSAFFWDSSHPTQAGWNAVYVNLKSSLQQFIGFY